MKFKFFLFQQVLAILSFTLNVNAQGVKINSFTTASSQNLSIGDVSNISNDVDLFTGRLNYGIKLTDMQLAGINIPIGVNYSTTGFKVQEIAGPLGLGWSPSFTGVITRSVRDEPDDYYKGFSGHDKTGNYNYGSYTNDLFDKLDSELWDSEPDQYFFSFLGFAGSFILNPEGQPVMQSNPSGLQILENGYINNRWLLRDQLGNKYMFGRESVTGVIENSRTSRNYEGGVDYLNYISAWHLIKIITANNDEINYSYTSSFNISWTNYVNMKRIAGNSCLQLTDATWNENVVTDVLSTFFLSKIEFKDQSIKFDYDLDRLDLLNGKALTKIRTYFGNAEKQTYVFDYSYFISTDGQAEKRLKLESISQSAPGSANKKLQSFFYNESTQLPARNSLKTDLWGYYNNNNLSSNIIGESDKMPNYNNTQANVLKKVVNALGGATCFEYQLNTYHDGTNYNDIGGLRLSETYQKAKETDQNNFFNHIQYIYLDPATNMTSGQKFDQGEKYSYSIGAPCVSTSGSNIYKSSESVSSLFDSNGSPVGYSYVTVKKGDGSSLRYNFTNYDDYPNEIGQGTYNFATQMANERPPRPGRGEGANNYAWLGNTVLNFAHGKILTEEAISATGELVNRKNYEYILTPRQNEVFGIRVIKTYVADLPRYTYGKTKYFSQELQLVKQTETFFRNNQVKQQVEQTYSYAAYAKNLVREIRQTVSGGKIDKYSYRYPFDMVSMPTSEPTGLSSIGNMVYNNIIANPVEVVHTIVKNDVATIVSANVTTYTGGTSLYSAPVPYEEYRFESKTPLLSSDYLPFGVSYDQGYESTVTDPRLTPYKRYSKYDQNRNLCENYINGYSAYTLPNCALYGYNGLYKIAEVLNAEFNSIAYTSFESSEKGNWNYSGIPTFDINAITGYKSYNLSKGPVTRNNLSTNKTYILTYWTKNSAPYTILGTQGAATLITERNGWKNFHHKISSIDAITISGTGLIDEIRFYPTGAKMKTFTYDPLVGMTSTSDENNRVAYNHYDELNRLQLIKDDNKNIRQALAYGNYGEPIEFFSAFSNASKSATFSKNDCGPGMHGSNVTYSVEQGRYRGKTQAVADALAQRDVDQNGQEYANSNGTCTNQTLYCRIEKNNYANFGYREAADVYIKFYANSECTIPYTLSSSLTAIVKESVSYYSIFNFEESSSNLNYVIPAGVNSYFVGRRTLYDSWTVYDPWDGSEFTERTYFTYDILSNGNSYIPLTSL